MVESAHDERPASPSPGVGRGVFVLVDPESRVTAAGRLWLERHGAAAIAELSAWGEIRVRVVGDAAMAAAHERFGGEAGTTDVLTFDLTEPTKGPGLKGDPVPRGPLDVDILVCADEALRQAQQRGHSLEQELLLYIIHGILHCLGYDDHDPDQAARMHAVEDRVLETLGVGAVYGRPAGGVS